MMRRDPSGSSKPGASSAPRFAARTALLDTENAFKIGPLIARVEAAGTRVIRCNIGEPDFPLPGHVRDEIKRRLDEGLTGYVDPQGILPLREAIAEDVGAVRGIDVTPDRVVVFPGAKPPIGLCQQVYCEAGDEVIYPSPGFPIYESFIRYVGARPVPLHLREDSGFAMTADDLEPLISKRTRLIFLNSPANPTGGVTSAREFERIAAVILRKAPTGIRIFSDEVYEKILFDDARHASLASVPGMAERTIIVSGVSKSYAWTGGRVGWAVFPTREEADVFRNLNINYFSSLPPYNQYGAVTAIRSAESAPAVARMTAAFQERRDFMVGRLRSIDGISCPMPKGAFYVFPNIAGLCDRLGAFQAWRDLTPESRDRSSPSTLVQLFLLFGHGLATLDRRSFGQIGAERSHNLRISIATAMEDLAEAADRLAAAAGDRDGFTRFMNDHGRLP